MDDHEIALQEADSTAELLETQQLDDPGRLCTNTECCFCTHEPNPADGYALADIAHCLPAERTQNTFGGRGGTVLPLTLPICNKCKSHFLLAQYLPLVLEFLVIGAALVFTSMRSFQEKHFLVECFGLFVLISAVCIFLCSLLRRVLRKKLGTEMRLHHVSCIEDYFHAGWFSLNDGKVIFSKKLPYYLIQFDDQEPLADNEEIQDDEEILDNDEQ